MELKIIKYTQYNEIKNVEGCKINESFFENYKSSHNVKWMLATSNMDQNQKTIFVAISCVTESDMTVNKDVQNISSKFETNIRVENRGKTVILKIEKSEKLESEGIKEIKDYKQQENIGGIVSFLDDENDSDEKDSNKIDSGKNGFNKHGPVCFIFNASGIYRLECTLNNKGLKNFEQFNYPKKLMNELETLYKSKSCLLRINDCIFNHYFHIEQYTEGIQVMQLYDLKTMQIQQIFNIYVEKNHPNKYSNSVLAISKNKQMIAFSSGYGNIALYLIENGLEIIRKDLGKDTKIVGCEFKDDNTLMIIKQTKDKTVLSIWHLCTNEVQDYDKNIKVEEDKESFLYSAMIPGKYVFIDNLGGILSIYDNIFKIDNKTKENQSSLPELELYKGGHKKETKDEDHSNKAALPIILNREPWITDDYKKEWIYLDQEKLIHLYIGKCTVQVWRKIKQEENFILEYFWTNEYDDEINDNGILQIVDLFVYKSGFVLKLKKNNNYIDLKWTDKDIVGHKDLMRHACIGLEYLNDQRNKLAGYENQHVFEEIKNNVSLMILRFIRNYPDIWKMLDIHYNLMASIIIGGSDTLIKYILFGDDVVKHTNLHIPRITRWTESKNNSNKSDLQIAIGLCEPGLERNRRILVVTYLLEYYSKNATEHHGWLINISKALPDLYTYNLESCVSELFYKKCMEGIEISNIIEHTDIIPKYIQIILKVKQKFTAFNPISKLISASEQKFDFKDGLKLELTKLYVKFLPKKYENYSPTVKTVPLHNFTVNSIHGNNNDKPSQLHPYLQHIIKLLKLLFIPRGYLVNHSADAERSSQLSPFVQLIRKENNDDIFNNPVMEAYRQFQHHDWRYYFKLFNCIDLASIVVAVVIMSVYVTPSFDTKNAFANVVTTQGTTIAISFTMLLLWFEFILYLRLISEPAKYIYIMLNIIKEIWIFLAFMILVMAGLAHSFLLLLQYPDFTNIQENSSSSTLFTGDSNFKIQKDFDRTEDNPAKSFVTSFLSTYSWLSGGFSQQDSWNFWAVKFITFFGSFLLVTILQNMFIAFMGGVYSNAFEKGRVALLRFRADSISDYEALDEIYFYPPPPEPKYIYYIGKSKSHENWDENVNKRENKNLYDDYESEQKNEEDTSVELNNKVIELNSKVDQACSKIEDTSVELNNKIVELNSKVDKVCSKIEEVNNKIDKLLNFK
ncbi:1275_t:CDS:2 [Funneliformis mosseae]|uniref:1275_t:CDS:1 n=1 Tax=Funneliformis mosseae TaxID=27381 RepID=A0A9N9A6B3_FUNMO|nr:1275_t:CDS:2 [Funneliformis mosseae]